MPFLAGAARDRADACPGALIVHQAADGGLARVRLPGGQVDAAQLRALADAARDLGDGRLELTSRGNIQLRGLARGAESGLGDRLAGAGLLPSATHERVRNIVASPLAGLDRPSVLPGLVADLDRALCAAPRLAELPGRFLFAIDDGRGDVAALAADVLLQSGPGPTSVNGIAWDASGLDSTDGAVGLMLTFALAFLDERAADTANSAAWRIEELTGGVAAVRRRVLAANPHLSLTAETTTSPVPARPNDPAGPITRADGGQALVVLAPLGRLTVAQVLALAEHAGPGGARITPWRSIVLLDPRDVQTVSGALRSAGFGVDPSSPWYGVSACTGRPGCAKALADVQVDAARAARSSTHRGRTVHWSGCARRCGRPAHTEVDLVATSVGYEFSR